MKRVICCHCGLELQCHDEVNIVPTHKSASGTECLGTGRPPKQKRVRKNDEWRQSALPLPGGKLV